MIILSMNEGPRASIEESETTMSDASVFEATVIQMQNGATYSHRITMQPISFSAHVQGDIDTYSRLVAVGSTTRVT